MTRKDIDMLWHKALRAAVEKGDDFTRFEFANLIEKHLIKSGYRKCAGGQRITQYCCMVEGAVKEEREACAKVCDGWLHADGNQCAEAIRARGET